MSLSVSYTLNKFQGLSTTISVPAQNHVARDYIVACLQSQNNPVDASVSCSDTAGNTYAQIGATVVSGVNYFRIYSAYNTAGNAANVVTVSGLDAAFSYNNLFVFGIHSTVSSFVTDPIHDNQGTTGFGTAIDSGNLTVGANAGIIAIYFGAPTLAPGSGYTQTLDSDNGQGGFGFVASEQKMNVTAAEHATATCSSNNWAIKAISFDEPTAGGSPLRFNSLLNGLSASGPFFRNPLG